MNYGQGVRAYSQTQTIAVSSQKQLIVMAYDGVIRLLRQAEAHLARKEIPEKIQCFERARDIVKELAGALDREKGGVIGENLWNLYLFFIRKITEANMTNDLSHLEEILPSLRTLRDAWAEMEIPEDDAVAQALNRHVPPPEAETHRLSVAG